MCCKTKNVHFYFQRFVLIEERPVIRKKKFQTKAIHPSQHARGMVLLEPCGSIGNTALTVAEVVGGHYRNDCVLQSLGFTRTSRPPCSLAVLFNFTIRCKSAMDWGLLHAAPNKLLT